MLSGEDMSVPTQDEVVGVVKSDARRAAAVVRSLNGDARLLDTEHTVFTAEDLEVLNQAQAILEKVIEGIKERVHGTSGDRLGREL